MKVGAISAKVEYKETPRDEIYEESIRIGRIYKIIHKQSSLCYIGKTFNELRHRFAQHKLSYKSWVNDKKATHFSIYDLFEKYGVQNFSIVLIKEYEVIDSKHLSVYEQLWINKHKANVNFKHAFRIYFRNCSICGTRYKTNQSYEVHLTSKKHKKASL